MYTGPNERSLSAPFQVGLSAQNRKMQIAHANYLLQTMESKKHTCIQILLEWSRYRKKTDCTCLALLAGPFFEMSVCL